MIFKQLKFKNYKTFYGPQTIDLTPPLKTEQQINDDVYLPNIALIGGLNGAGKTTILKAIWYALFGTQGMSNEEIVKSNANIINNRAFSENSTDSSLSLVLEKDTEEWEIEVKFYINKDQKVTHEERIIYIRKENSQSRKKVQFNNLLEFTKYTNAIIPQYAAPFFIFDGEEISTLIRKQDTQQMITAINTITGANAYNILINDLQQLSSNIQKEISKTTNQDSLDQMFKKLELSEREYNLSTHKLTTLQSKISGIESQIHDLKVKRKDILSSNNNSRTIVAKEQGRYEIMLESNKKELETVFQNQKIGILLEKKIASLKRNLNSEKIARENELMREKALKPFNEFINNAIKVDIDPPLTFEQLSQIKLKGEKWYAQQFNINITDTTKLDFIHDITDSEYRILSSVPSYTISAFSNLVSSIKSHENKLKQLEQNLLEAPEDMDATAETEQIDIHTRELIFLKEQLTPLRIQNISLKDAYLAAQKSYTKQNNKSTSSSLLITELEQVNRTLSAIETHVRELTLYKTMLVKEEFESMLRKLMRKDDEFSEINFDLATATIRLYNNHKQEIDLESRSAGEKQMISSALIWALTRVSYLNLPIIIDTPLGRLDSKHRNNLINNFYKELGEQVIILSTDTEFDANYLTTMNDVSYAQYTLDYDEHKKYTIIRDGYFNFEQGGIQ